MTCICFETPLHAGEVNVQVMSDGPWSLMHVMQTRYLALPIANTVDSALQQSDGVKGISAAGERCRSRRASMA